MTFPIMTKGGGVCACEASAGGRVSRVGARFTQERTAQLSEDAERSVTSILPLAAHIYVPTRAACARQGVKTTARERNAANGRF